MISTRRMPATVTSRPEYTADLSHSLFASIFSRSKFIPIDATCGMFFRGTFYYSRILYVARRFAPSPSANWRVIMSNYYENCIMKFRSSEATSKSLCMILYTRVHMYFYDICQSLEYYTLCCCASRIYIFFSMYVSIIIYIYFIFYVKYRAKMLARFRRIPRESISKRKFPADVR